MADDNVPFERPLNKAEWGTTTLLAHKPVDSSDGGKAEGCLVKQQESASAAPVLPIQLLFSLYSVSTETTCCS